MEMWRRSGVHVGRRDVLIRPNDFLDGLRSGCMDALVRANGVLDGLGPGVWAITEVWKCGGGLVFMLVAAVQSCVPMAC
eukprot:363245-Chlamydomonas_euryale.AAC.9